MSSITFDEFTAITWVKLDETLVGKSLNIWGQPLLRAKGKETNTLYPFVFDRDVYEKDEVCEITGYMSDSGCYVCLWHPHMVKFINFYKQRGFSIRYSKEINRQLGSFLTEVRKSRQSK
jgi:hypothetical protein